MPAQRSALEFSDRLDRLAGQHPRVRSFCHGGMAGPFAAAILLPAIRYSTYVEFFRVYWRGNGSGRNLPLELPPPRRGTEFPGKNAMKVFVFDLLAYGEQLDHLKVGSELPYPLSNRYFKADVAVRTYAEHLDAWEEMDRL
jgi:hypothetical protein